MSWQKQITRNEFKLYLRNMKKYIDKDKEKSFVTLPLNEDISVEESINRSDFNFIPDEYLETFSKRQILYNIINKSLSDVQRKTLFFYFNDELKISEIAEFMECSEGTVKSRLSSAKNIVKNISSKAHSIIPAIQSASMSQIVTGVLIVGTIATTATVEILATNENKNNEVSAKSNLDTATTAVSLKEDSNDDTKTVKLIETKTAETETPETKTIETETVEDNTKNEIAEEIDDNNKGNVIEEEKEYTYISENNTSNDNTSSNINISSVNTSNSGNTSSSNSNNTSNNTKPEQPINPTHMKFLCTTTHYFYIKLRYNIS